MKAVTDRRVQKTRALLQEALLDLIVEKGYEAVTVQDLSVRANIGRSTFYFHYEDKEKLLLDCIDQLLSFLQEQKPGSDEVEGGGIRFRFSLAMLQHVQGHRKVYAAVVGKQGTAVLYHMKQMLQSIIEDEIRQWRGAGVLKELPDGVLVTYILGSFWTLLHWWMEQGTPYTAHQLDELFHDITVTGISA
ncbi:TetR/AcrR family transcriptional regulator [Paenibacillus senegalensis]|uniref:TetR/AcrR family transcriptional regulator n=1 Tax=Paenibacillus senegalensis TaxID=1465766 RepID=UPI0002895C57|nr:TetR/AcrR family transcriptional regulator [Paenibacillus senegalensis]